MPDTVSRRALVAGAKPKPKRERKNTMSEATPTRTEQGYAYWKEIPSKVKSAREIAAFNVAMRNLKDALLGWTERWGEHDE